MGAGILAGFALIVIAAACLAAYATAVGVACYGRRLAGRLIRAR